MGEPAADLHVLGGNASRSAALCFIVSRQKRRLGVIVCVVAAHQLLGVCGETCATSALWEVQHQLLGCFLVLSPLPTDLTCITHHEGIQARYIRLKTSAMLRASLARLPQG